MSEPAAAAPLRVLTVTPRFHPLTGGVETHVAEVVGRLARAGVAVTILTTAVDGAPAQEQANGVEVRRVRTFFRHAQYYLAPDVYRVVAGGGWDLVHCQSYHTFVAPLGMLAARRARLPYVVTFHGGGHSSAWRHRSRPLQLRALRPLLAGAAKLITCAAFEVPFYGGLLGLPASQFVHIPNGCDLPPVPAGPNAAAAPACDGDLLVSLGRLERYKGHQRVIAAFPRVLERRPSARLLVLGSGPFEPELRELVGRLRLVDRVEIRGLPPSERGAMAATLASAALVMLLSEYETHPVALLEALALGRPVLVAHNSGMAELVERGLARSVADDATSDAIATAILEQLTDPLRPASVALPTWDDCARQLLALYRAVVAGA